MFHEWFHRRGSIRIFSDKKVKRKSSGKKERVVSDRVHTWKREWDCQEIWLRYKWARDPAERIRVNKPLWVRLLRWRKGTLWNVSWGILSTAFSHWSVVAVWSGLCWRTLGCYSYYQENVSLNPNMSMSRGRAVPKNKQWYIMIYSWDQKDAWLLLTLQV